MKLMKELFDYSDYCATCSLSPPTKGGDMAQRGRAMVTALIASIAVGASTAGIASAENGITAAEYPTTLHAGGIEQVLTSSVGGVCTEGTVQGEITEETTELSLTSTSAGCSTGGTLPATVTMNGCKTRYHNYKKLGKGHYTSTVDVVCPPGKVKEIHTYAKAPHSTPVCTTTVPPQKNLEHAEHIVIPGVGELTIEDLIAKIQTHGLCGSSEEDAEFHSTFELEGSSEFHVFGEEE